MQTEKKNKQTNNILKLKDITKIYLVIEIGNKS